MKNFCPVTDLSYRWNYILVQQTLWYIKKHLEVLSRAKIMKINNSLFAKMEGQYCLNWQFDEINNSAPHSKTQIEIQKVSHKIYNIWLRYLIYMDIYGVIQDSWQYFSTRNLKSDTITLTFFFQDTHSGVPLTRYNA